MIQTDIVVIGAGVAGLSTAYHLASRGCRKVIVFEKEKKLGGHASGRNAGMIRQAVSDPVLASLAREGREALRLAGKKGWKDLEFRSNGSLLLARGAERTELGRIQRTLRSIGVEAYFISPQEAAGRVRLLEGGDFSSALFCPSDAFVEIRPLLKGFHEKLKAAGVPVYRGLQPEGILRKKDGFCLKVRNRTFFTKKVVNAAGAWAESLARGLGALRIPLKAYRRHLFVSRRSNGFSAGWPFVWDLSHDFYFRPLTAGTLLLSPCDKALFKISRRGRILGEKIDPGMEPLLRKKLNSFSERMSSVRVLGGKAGLRTLTPDGRFVIGEDPYVRGFYWVAGLGGHGVTTCFSVGRLAGDIILGKRADREIEAAVSPGRFI